MLKAGIFLDIENLVRCGGWGIRYRVVRELVEAQGATVLRANAYMAIDSEREEKDIDYKRKKQEYREAVRRESFHLVLKKVQRYRNSEGDIITKANADLDLAIDALLQADNLDYILLGSGDGDFFRLVRAIQNRGKRVDLLSFSNTSEILRCEVDNHFSGYLVPGLLPSIDNSSRIRGVMHVFNEEKGFAFLAVRTGLGVLDIRDDVFCHISDFRHRDGRVVTDQSFAQLKTQQKIIEFELVERSDGKVKAVNATEFDPEVR